MTTKKRKILDENNNGKKCKIFVEYSLGIRSKISNMYLCGHYIEFLDEQSIDCH